MGALDLTGGSRDGGCGASMPPSRWDRTGQASPIIDSAQTAASLRDPWRARLQRLRLLIEAGCATRDERYPGAPIAVRGPERL